jgi:hypothetical protein
MVNENNDQLNGSTSYPTESTSITSGQIQNQQMSTESNFTAKPSDEFISSINHIFSLIANHKLNNYSSICSNTYINMRTAYSFEPKMKKLDEYFGAKITQSNFKNFIIKVFSEYNPCYFGSNVLQFISDMKSSNISTFYHQDLRDCLRAIIIQPPPISNSSISASNTTTINASSFVSGPKSTDILSENSSSEMTNS